MKKSKFLILGSLASLSAIPFVAARCGTSAKSEETNKSKLEKDKITGELTNNNDKNTNTNSNEGKNNIDTSNNDSSTETINNEMNNSSTPNNNGVQGDEPKAETQVAPETSESSSSSSNNNGGNYSVNNHPNGMSSDAPGSTPEVDAKLKKELEDVEKVKKIVNEHKDAFAAFHTQGDFLDQIAVYANDEGISNLKLQRESEKDKKLIVDNEGKENKNTIKLKIGSQDFEVKLGIVLESGVVTKYHLKDEPSKILSNHEKTPDGKWIVDKNWGYNMRDKLVVITQLGYHKDGNNFKLTTLGKKTIKVPRQLPLKVDSLSYSFYNLQSESIENIEKWDVNNIAKADGAFDGASKFSQDLSSWKLKKETSKKSIFKGASKMTQHLDNIAKSWGVKKEDLV